MTEKRIWKYEIPLEDVFTIAMPRGSTLRHVGVQHGKPCMWVEVDPQEIEATQTFRLVGTGHGFKRGMDYLGTVSLENDNLAFHLYAEEIE